MPRTAILAAGLAGLLGSIPSGYLLYRMRTGGDIRLRGSGNIGATNVMRNAGKGLGALTLLLDTGKGYAAVWIARQAGVSGPGLAAVLLLAIAGHLFTPWLGFHGGKGVATGLGAFLCLAPRPALAAIVLWVVVAAAWRYVSLASVAAAATLPALVWWWAGREFGASVCVAGFVASGLIIWRHRGNLARLRAGTEPRLFERGAT